MNAITSCWAPAPIDSIATTAADAEDHAEHRQQRPQLARAEVVDALLEFGQHLVDPALREPSGGRDGRARHGRPPAAVRGPPPRRGAGAGAGGAVAAACAPPAGFTSATSVPSGTPSMAARFADWCVTFTSRASNRSPDGHVDDRLAALAVDRLPRHREHVLHLRPGDQHAGRGARTEPRLRRVEPQRDLELAQRPLLVARPERHARQRRDLRARNVRPGSAVGVHRRRLPDDERCAVLLVHAHGDLEVGGVRHVGDHAARPDRVADAVLGQRHAREEHAAGGVAILPDEHEAVDRRADDEALDDLPGAVGVDPRAVPRLLDDGQGGVRASCGSRPRRARSAPAAASSPRASACASGTRWR